MELKVNAEKLNEILSAFYSLTGIKIIIFDEGHNIVCSYPEADCAFCKKMKESFIGNAKCAENDVKFFNESLRSGSVTLYTCHAGLVEGCAPLRQNGRLLGYIMFGQISDLPTRETLTQNVSAVCREYGLDEREFVRVAKSIKLKSYDNIMAAAKIFDACISYMLMNEMLIPKQDKIVMECERYIEENLPTVTPDSLCRSLGISRTAMYTIFSQRIGEGVSTFIRKKQMSAAKEMLENSELSVREIAALVGFDDYNYFSKVFKRHNGCSPRDVRRSHILPEGTRENT